jgi:predicted Zn-dependent protease
MPAPRTIARTAASLALALAAWLSGGCSVNPATGHREFTLVSADQELAIGREGYAATLAEYGQYDDARLGAYVDSVGQRVARASDLPRLEWHFTVLDDPVVNAFAMPGGYIYITRGILAHLNSEAQLAGVLGHEIGHVTARHGARQMTQQQLAGLGLVVAGSFSETFRRYSATAQQALGLLMLKYSRDDESQADALGIRYATAAGYDPREIPATYATLKRISERAGSGLPFYLSTHPDPGDREARTSALAQQAVAGRANLAVRGHGYLDHVRGVAFGDDPRQGYFEGTHYFQPVLGFELEFPAGWRTQNGRSAVVAVEPQQQASMQLALAPNAGALSPAEYVAGLRRDGRIATTDGGGENVGGWPAWVGRVGVPADAGAVSLLDAAWVRQSPERLLQLLGATTAARDANERAILAAMRSLRPLQDARRAQPTPDRLRLVPSPASGAFRSVIARAGASALSAEDLSILNGVGPDDPVANGQWLKTVEAGRRR